MPFKIPHWQNGSNTHCPQMMRGFVNPDYLFGIHIKLNGGALGYKYRISTGSMVTLTDLSTVAGNVMELPLFDSNDGHFTLACAVTQVDSFHVWGNHHDSLSNPQYMHHIECYDTVNGFGGSAWRPGDEPGLATDSEASGRTYTYHVAERFSDGRVIWTMSQSENDTSTGGEVGSRGRDWLAWVSTNHDSGSGTPLAWTPLIPSTNGEFAITASVSDESEANRVYILGLYVEIRAGLERLWAAGIWRTRDSDATSQQKPWIIYSDNYGVTWKTITGTTQTMPITWQNCTNALISSAPSFSGDYRQGVCVDPVTHNPSIIVLNGATGTSYVRLYWDGAAWQSEAVPALGGEVREVWIAGKHYYRAVSHTLGDRLILRDKDDSSRILRVGNQVQVLGVGGYSANHCSVYLREAGVYAVNVGNGDTPEIHMFGNNPYKIT